MTKRKPQQNLVGQRFHLLVVKEYLGKVDGLAGMWKCLCDCGNETRANSSSLKRNHTKSCGCWTHNYNSLVGKQINYFTVLEKVGAVGKYALYKCLCKCGNIVERSSRNLASPRIKSCGCLRIQLGTAPLAPGESGFNDLFNKYKRNAKTRDVIFDLSKDEFRRLTKENCSYCGIAPSQISNISINGKYIYNGVDRIDSNLSYINSNVVACCKTCNIAKKDMSRCEFLTWIKKVYDHQNKSSIAT